MQAMDGERHRRHCGVVSRAFTPRLVAMLEERAERYAEQAIDALRRTPQQSSWKSGPRSAAHHRRH